MILSRVEEQLQQFLVVFIRIKSVGRWYIGTLPGFFVLIHVLHASSSAKLPRQQFGRQNLQVLENSTSSEILMREIIS